MRSLFLHIALVFTFLSSPAAAQLQFSEGFGAQVGLSFNLGTHFNRLGFMAKVCYHYEYIQANFQICGYHNFRAFPIGTPSWEGQMKLGVVAAFGQKDVVHYSPFLRETGNQTSRPYSIGYSFNYYFDTQHTSQFTGSVGFGIHGFSFLMENDYFAFMSKDRFRSGAFGLYYRYQNTQFAICNIGWTPDPYEQGTETIRDNKDVPAKHGFRLMENVRYREHSAGILSLQVEHYMGYGQFLGAAIGIDAEQIRNALQNRFVHDSFLLKDPHIPMIDSEGNQFLYRKDQKIRPANLYFQFLLNTGSLY